jgi:hypothetical protein
MMSKHSSRIVSLTLALVLFITPMAVLAQDGTPTIEGFVFNDKNQNGLFDEGDTGVDGVTVELLPVADGLSDVSVITSGGGFYAFTNLELGDYLVREIDPADHISTTFNEVSVTIADTDAVVTVNFGDADIVDLGQISGFVYDDADRDGEFDLGEDTIPKVPVKLFGFDGEVIETVTTDQETGKYTLSKALAGVNTIQEIDPSPYLSTTPNKVEVILKNPGDSVEGINFGDFIPTEGEVPKIDLLLMKFFDIALLDFQDLRAMGGWGYGNIAKAYFIAQLGDTPLIDILGMRETMGWGNIMKAVLGRAGLKGYNLGMVVSGRDAPQSVHNLMNGCSLISEPEKVQELFSSGASNGTIKKACKLAQEVDGATFETLVVALELLADHTQKQVREKLQSGATNQLNNANGGNNGNHGPPPCKGKNKYDEGCY